MQQIARLIAFGIVPIVWAVSAPAQTLQVADTPASDAITTIPTAGSDDALAAAAAPVRVVPTGSKHRPVTVAFAVIPCGPTAALTDDCR